MGYLGTHALSFGSLKTPFSLKWFHALHDRYQRNLGSCYRPLLSLLNPPYTLHSHGLDFVGIGVSSYLRLPTLRCNLAFYSLHKLNQALLALGKYYQGNALLLLLNNESSQNSFLLAMLLPLLHKGHQQKLVPLLYYHCYKLQSRMRSMQLVQEILFYAFFFP